MDISVELKKYHIMEYLMSIKDLNLLNKVEKLIISNQSISKKEIVAYSIDEKPLTVEAYNKELENAEQDILTGRIISSEELKKEMKSWKK